MSVGNDAWKGVVELGVESSLPLVERRIQEFRARKVKAMNDTDDEVVDGVVIFSNERFTREIEIGRDSSLFLSLFLSDAYFARNIAARLHLSSNGFRQSTTLFL